MACTTILVGKKASYDGAPIIARNEDSANGEFNPKRFIVTQSEDQPRLYHSVLSHLDIQLPDNPLRYTSTPNADLKDGIWGEAGINAANVAMSATETITTNERVLGADPFVEVQPAQGTKGQADYKPLVPGGITEEDFLTTVLPYIHTAREGVTRLGSLLEKYGTSEMNGVAFSDSHDIWWIETVGGHHWIARRVPEDCYVTMPNQLGIDDFDIKDAFGKQENFMCSADLREWMKANNLDLSVDGETGHFNPRDAFGSHSDTDHVYNTPRAWFMQRYLNPYDEDWDTDEALHNPESDDIPWARQPERKVTIEDIKYVLSSHYQGTPYDPYGKRGTHETRTMYRPIGINRQSELSVMEIRPDKPAAYAALQWISFGSNPFNAIEPYYTNVDSTPAYLESTTTRVTTENHYWENRVIAALADEHYADNQQTIEAYQIKAGAQGHENVRLTDAKIEADKSLVGKLDSTDAVEVHRVLEAANEQLAEKLKKDTDDLLNKVLYTTSMRMKNGFFLSDN
jgi:dipeptidase